MPYDKSIRRDEPASYRICFIGMLDPSWSSMLAGMTLTCAQLEDERYVTTLSGQLIDQAALMGVLHLVYDLGLLVVLVERDNFDMLIKTANDPVPALYE